MTLNTVISKLRELSDAASTRSGGNPASRLGDTASVAGASLQQPFNKTEITVSKWLLDNCV